MARTVQLTCDELLSIRDRPITVVSCLLDLQEELTTVIKTRQTQTRNVQNNGKLKFCCIVKSIGALIYMGELCSCVPIMFAS